MKDGVNLEEAKDLEEAKEKIERKAETAKVEALERCINDMQNRARRNNVVIWNAPEGTGSPISWKFLDLSCSLCVFIHWG